MTVSSSEVSDEIELPEVPSEPFTDPHTPKSNNIDEEIEEKLIHLKFGCLVLILLILIPRLLKMIYWSFSLMFLQSSQIKLKKSNP